MSKGTVVVYSKFAPRQCPSLNRIGVWSYRKNASALSSMISAGSTENDVLFSLPTHRYVATNNFSAVEGSTFPKSASFIIYLQI